jgi:photosystem II stability/assembly factor-like uncharacterized protein
VKQFALLIASTLALAGVAFAADDPLATPARASNLAQQRAITSLARVGEHDLVAVGQRGHVLRSNDGGKTWTQAKVPLSSDLTAVQFVDANTGYAVGHDGVVLKSVDGGAAWTKLLDGRSANMLALEDMRRIVDAGGGDEDRRLLDEAKRNVELGPDKPFLDLWFTNANEGFVVGAYNLILHTVDGGRTWDSWYARTQNPKLLNLYAIRPAGGSLYIAGEGGLLLKLDAQAQRFKALPSPYEGSFFGLVGTRAGVLAFGMRANAFLSCDEGRTWRPVRTGLAASITAGDALADGRVALVDQAGNIALSRDAGESFSRVGAPPPMPLSAVAFAREGLVLAGVRGLRALESSRDTP